MNAHANACTQTPSPFSPLRVMQSKSHHCKQLITPAAYMLGIKESAAADRVRGVSLSTPAVSPFTLNSGMQLLNSATLFGFSQDEQRRRNMRCQVFGQFHFKRRIPRGNGVSFPGDNNVLDASAGKPEREII